MENQDPDKEDILRAKQAVSPAGLGDRSDKATTLPGNDTPDDSPIAGTEGGPPEGDDEPGADVHQMHPNRNRDGKADLDKPAYGGS